MVVSGGRNIVKARNTHLPGEIDSRISQCV